VYNNTVAASIRNPRQVFWLVGMITLLLCIPFPFVEVDVDPEAMLSENEPVRVYHNEVKQQMGLSDIIFMGVTLDQHDDGVFNVSSLGRIHELTSHILQVEGVISHNILSLSNVDTIQPAGPGAISFSRLMPSPPTTREEALAIRERSADNPFLLNNQISKDGKALAIYIPITAKDQSWRISNEIEAKIKQLNGPENYHIAGLPVAQDTFGVQMFIQMAISAPAAMALIGILIFLFFRQIHLTFSALGIAMASVIITMGLFIASGSTLHIMSSMIPIFIMPVAVLDAVHVISKFYDEYNGNREETLNKVMRGLWKPMLYTSVTSSIGFMSLLLAPIPPVQVFGFFTGIGILVAWILTMTLLPAIIMRLPEHALASFGQKAKAKDTQISSALKTLSQASTKGRYAVLGTALIFIAISIFGINSLVVNDNPTKWFEKEHPIRAADTLINDRFAGSYMVYLNIGHNDSDVSPGDTNELIQKITAYGPQGKLTNDKLADLTAQENDPVKRLNATRTWVTQQMQGQNESSSPNSDDDLSFDVVDDTPASDVTEDTFAIWSNIDGILATAMQRFQITKDPAMIRWTDQLAEHIQQSGFQTKINGPSDLIKKINKELHEGNTTKYTVPDSREGIMETYLSFQSSHDMHRLWHIITRDYSSMTLSFQLNSGDNVDVDALTSSVDTWIENNPPPQAIKTGWSGLSYINITWQQKMVSGMASALGGSALVILLMMTFLFRSFWWAVISMVPLSMSIVMIYGMTGLIGKDYDMPIAIISALALGLSIDFAIHFIVQYREKLEQHSFAEAIDYVFHAPAQAISRNAIVIAIGFSPLLLAPLVPYQTVGWLMMSIMSVSALATFLIMPAIISLFRPKSIIAER